jgi:hypothetical protein
MDIMLVLDLVLKGLSVISTLVTVGENAAPAIKAVVSLVNGAKAGTLTYEQINQTEADLDAMIAEFNKPLE